MIGPYSKDTDDQTRTSQSNTNLKLRRVYNPLAHANKIENKSKSVRGINEKSNLLFCNMNTYGTRKVKYEKVQVNTTQRDGGL